MSNENINGSTQFSRLDYSPCRILRGSPDNVSSIRNEEFTQSTYNGQSEELPRQGMQATTSSHPGHGIDGDYSIPGAFPADQSEPRRSAESRISNQTSSTGDQHFFDALDWMRPMADQDMNMMSSHLQPSPFGASINQDRRTPHTPTRFVPFEDPLLALSTEIDEINYSKYAVPKELLQREDTTSGEIRNLLTSSVARLEQQQLQELAQSSAENQLNNHLGVRQSRGSETSVLSNDSGYDSMRLEPEVPQPKARRGFGGFTALFRRKGKKIASSSLPVTSDENFPQTLRSAPFAPSPTGNLYDPNLSFEQLLAAESFYQAPAPLSSLNVETVPAVQIERAPEPEPEPPTPEPIIVECVSCLDEFEVSEVRKLECHSYCSPCFEALISAALGSESQWPPKCCLNPIPSSSILPNISSDMIELYEQRAEEWGTPAGERIYCSRARCASWIPQKNIDHASHTAKCKNCRTKTCSICRGNAHGGSDCPDDPSLRATESLAEAEGWRRCYSCQAFVAHNAGCRHMTCRCKAQFCYVCGLRWKTCPCSEADLMTRQTRVDTERRQARLEREREEAAIDARRSREQAEAEAREAEERELIREVEEFMRIETERLERIAEQERQEAAARAAEERQRLEEARLVSVHEMFRAYKLELESLHDLQRVLIAERQEFEKESLKRDLENTLDSLSLRHITTAQLMTVESQSLVSDSQYGFDEEYQRRLAEERRIEAQYVADLEHFHRGNPNAQQVILQAQVNFRRDQNEEYRKWEEFRHKQLQDLVVAETRKIQLLSARQAAEIREANKRNAEAWNDWNRKCYADAKWVEKLVSLREVMLGEREQEEYVRDVWS